MHCLFVNFSIGYVPGAWARHYSLPFVLFELFISRHKHTIPRSIDATMSLYPRHTVDVRVRLDPSTWNHIDVGGMIGDKYATAAPIVLRKVKKPNPDRWYKAWAASPAQLIDVAPHSQTPEMSPQSSLERVPNIGESPNHPQARTDAQSIDEPSNDHMGGHKDFKDSADAKEFLDRAATHSTRTIAIEDGVTARTINRRILRAAQTIAEQDGSTKNEVIAELDFRRLGNGVPQKAKTIEGISRMREAPRKRAMQKRDSQISLHESTALPERAFPSIASDVLEDTA